MGRRKERILDVMTEMDWRTSVVFAALVFIALRFVLPRLPIENQFLAGIVDALQSVAHLIGLVLLVPAPISAFAASRRKARRGAQKEINSIRDLDRWQVEQLVAESYRRKGYTVLLDKVEGGNGMVDMRLQKGGRMYLLFCRHWQSPSVDSDDLQELTEFLASEHAAGLIVISSGVFTPDAKKFATTKPIDLIGLERLAALTRDK